MDTQKAVTTSGSPEVFVIITLFKSQKWVDNCLTSVLASRYPHFKIVVVDNNSDNAEGEYIRAKFPEIIVIRNNRNYGFAEGNNIGIRHAIRKGADYVVLLNIDTKVDPEWLTELTSIGESDSQIGIIGGLQYTYDGEEIDIAHMDPACKSAEFKNDVEAHAPLKNAYRVAALIGNGFAIKRAVTLRVGLLDPLYFIYHEELDFCRRVAHAGYEIALAPKSIVYHHRSYANKATMSRQAQYLTLRNYFLYILKDHSHSFYYALKMAFVWTNWDKIFVEMPRRPWLNLRAKIHLLLLLPLILWRRMVEPKKACYW